MAVKSILRYPGGKFKAIKFIQPFWENSKHNEYREPFVGGGSVFNAKPLVEHNWINDVDKNLYSFYKIISNKKTREKLISELLNFVPSKKAHDELFYSKPKDHFGRAKRFYILNRCSFSGITMWNSFIGDVRYNIESAQNTIRDVGEKLAKTEITSVDFEEIIKAKPKSKNGKVFIFLDPPYAESRQVAAYAHSFTKDDHIRLAKLLKETKHDFLLTYDDCEFVRELYDWAYLYPKTWTYSVANVRTHFNPRESGNELFISNINMAPASEIVKEVVEEETTEIQFVPKYAY